MYILDRYVLRLFFKVLLVSFMSLTGLYVMVVSVSNLDEFVLTGQQQGGLLRVMFEFYGPRVLTFFDRMHALLTLMAAMFTISWLQRTNELVAIQAGGVSNGRIVRPLVIATILVSVLGIFNRELFIPRFRSLLVRDPGDALGPTRRTATPKYDHETDIFLSGGKMLTAEATVLRPVFRLPRKLHGFGRQLEAERAVYSRETEQRPAGYLLDKVSRPADIDSLASAQLEGETILFTKQDYDWLEPGQCFVSSSIEFEQLSAGSMWQQFASSAELLRGLRTAGLNYGPEARVTLHSRFTEPFLDLTLLFLGLPLVVSRHQRGVFVAIGHTTLLVTVFVIVVMTSRVLGSNFLISPSLAAWMPLIVFVPLASALAPKFWD